jgi:hypothetical protein
MRTTLTLDDDVAALLSRVQKEKDLTMREVVNQALRRGLESISEPKPATRRFRTKPFNLGRSVFPNMDNVWEIIDEIEGPMARL